MIYFDKDFLDYLSDLSNHNERDWFHTNKKRYEKSLKEPFANFLDVLIEKLQDIEGPIPHSGKEGMMRINRDTRFSKDKTPYKTHMAAIISAHGKGNKRLPGMYIQISPEDLRFYSGCHMLEKEDLINVRNHIKDNLNEFNDLLNDNKFKSTFGEVLGEKHKRLAPEYAEIVEEQPLIANKGFYYFKKYSAEIILKEGLEKTLMDDYKVGYPLGQFLKRGILGGKRESN